ncbi:MAG TPA: glycosyltransferase family 4 protein [Clostridia bacterium]|nr:glycosyltransferase family 4 protein [Clostridia bacterium]
MRIAYVITRSDAVGGAHIHVIDLASALLTRGHEVIVLVGGHGPFTEELWRKGIQFHSMPYLGRSIRPARDALAFLALRQTLGELNPDLVSLHSSKAGWLGRLVGTSLGLPTVFTAHGWAFTEGVPNLSRVAYAVAEKLAAPFCVRIITVSLYDLELALHYRIASPQKLVAIHNGMPDVPETLRAAPEESPPAIVMVARFEAQKDHATLLRALAQLSATPWKLILVGDGPLRPAIENLTVNLGLSGRVHFVGARLDVADILARAQVFALISNWEGFPRSILEAMRAGLPVVASDVGGVNEAVVDGETGFLVPRSDTVTLAQRLKLLLDNPALRLRQGQAGRARYASHFTFEQMLEKTLAVYRECIEDKVKQLGTESSP